MNNAIDYASEHKSCYSQVKQLLNGKVFSFKRENDLSTLAVKKVDFPDFDKIQNTSRLTIESSECYIFIKAVNPNDIVGLLNQELNYTPNADDLSFAIA